MPGRLAGWVLYIFNVPACAPTSAPRPTSSHLVPSDAPDIILGFSQERSISSSLALHLKPIGPQSPVVSRLPRYIPEYNPAELRGVPCSPAAQRTKNKKQQINFDTRTSRNHPSIRPSLKHRRWQCKLTRLKHLKQAQSVQTTEPSVRHRLPSSGRTAAITRPAFMYAFHYAPSAYSLRPVCACLLSAAAWEPMTLAAICCVNRIGLV